MMGTGEQPAKPDDLLDEGKRAKALLATVPGMKGAVAGIRLVNDAVLAHVLFALWDNGFYEYALTHPRFRPADVAGELGLDQAVLECLLDHLVGRGVLRASDDGLGLSEHGTALFSALCRGTLTLYLGGYGPLLGGLAPLLRGEIELSDHALARSERHVGVGSEQLACVRIVPAVLKILARRKARCVLDLGCGTGGFLIQLARSDPSFRGIGVDMSEEAVQAAGKNAAHRGVDDRLKFRRAEVGAGRLPLDKADLDRIEGITAMYLLHEFGRDGRDRVVQVLRELKAALPGRLLVFAECLPADVRAMQADPPTTFSQLDYQLIHPLSQQGSPLSVAEWETILEDAGPKLLEVQGIHWMRLYVSET